MDDKATPSLPTREVWQFEADKLLGVNAPPWPSDIERVEALTAAGLEHWLPPANPTSIYPQLARGSLSFTLPAKEKPPHDRSTQHAARKPAARSRTKRRGPSRRGRN
jgi:hypothetical protein